MVTDVIQPLDCHIVNNLSHNCTCFQGQLPVRTARSAGASGPAFTSDTTRKPRASAPCARELGYKDLQNAWRSASSAYADVPVKADSKSTSKIIIKEIKTK